MISIAMTTYNGEKYVEEQMESILAQSRKADEVIIFDDCSTDRTAELVTRFINKNGLNWIFQINSKNIGFSENFTQAIKKTNGDIIFLCDQDDVWHPDKIEKMAAIFEKNEVIKVLNTGFKRIDSQGKIIPLKSRINRSNNNIITKRLRPGCLQQFKLDYIIWRNISPGCTSAFSKECKNFFIDNHTSLCPHDWEINIFGAVLDGLYFYNSELTDYRIHSDNTIGLADFSIATRLSAVKQDKRIGTEESEYRRARAYINSVWFSILDNKAKNVILRYNRLTEQRYAAVYGRNLARWFASLLHLRDYLKLRGVQGILNDLLIIIKSPKIKDQ